MPGLITNSSLCTFDTNPDVAGDQFNIIFTPDFKLAAPTGYMNYKLSDTNPGQFYYNVFYNGEVGDSVQFSFEIPSLFVTQGAVPVHAYSGVDMVMMDGQTCLTPVGEIANVKFDDLQVTDLDGDGVKEYTFSITVPETGFIYVNMHLDLGPEKETGWIREGGTDNAIDNPLVTSPNHADLDEGTAFQFATLINGTVLTDSQDVIYNDNIWKNLKGMGGTFQIDQSGSEGLDEIAIQNQHVIIFDSKNNRMGDAYTDADGWYYAQFMATGKKTDYKVYWDQNNNNVIDTGEKGLVKAVAMGGAAGKWAEVNLTVVDPVGYVPDHGDFKVDSHGGLLP
jgi:hypothetical protein